MRIQPVAPRPHQKPGFGTAFGYVPNDGKAAPGNELLNQMRAVWACNILRVFGNLCRVPL
jgi:hypothetical protein